LTLYGGIGVTRPIDQTINSLTITPFSESDSHPFDASGSPSKALRLGEMDSMAAKEAIGNHFIPRFGLRSTTSLVISDFVIASVHTIPTTPNRAPIHITSEKASRKDDVAPEPLCVK
jgi:hypothetical protein